MKLENQEPQNQELIIDRLKRVNPKRHIVFAALDELSDSAEISQFMREYAQWIADHTDKQEHIDNPFQAASDSVGYALGYGFQGTDTEQLWKGTVENLEHPLIRRATKYKL